MCGKRFSGPLFTCHWHLNFAQSEHCIQVQFHWNVNHRPIQRKGSDSNGFMLKRNFNCSQESCLKHRRRNRGTLGARTPQDFAINKEVPFSFSESGPFFLRKSALKVSCPSKLEMLPTSLA